VKFAYKKKEFLSPETGDTSSILLEAEDSDNGTKKTGTYAVVITDNHSRVELEFYLGTAKHRKQSMDKINLLITRLIRFGHTMMLQSQAIDRASRKASKPAKKSPTKKTSRKKGNLGDAS
jgi:hypothetical protein